MFLIVLLAFLGVENNDRNDENGKQNDANNTCYHMYKKGIKD